MVVMDFQGEQTRERPRQWHRTWHPAAIERRAIPLSPPGAAPSTAPAERARSEGGARLSGRAS